MGVDPVVIRHASGHTIVVELGFERIFGPGEYKEPLENHVLDTVEEEKSIDTTQDQAEEQEALSVSRTSSPPSSVPPMRRTGALVSSFLQPLTQGRTRF